MSRVPDSDRDVYGDFVVAVTNAARHALKAQGLMNDMETMIVEDIRDRLFTLDPSAVHARKVKLVRLVS